MSEREKFEKWYAETGSMYIDMEAYWWECWQAALSTLDEDRDELVKALRRQFNSDKTLLEMTDECTQIWHEAALDEHNAAHKEIELILAKYQEQS